MSFGDGLRRLKGGGVKQVTESPPQQRAGENSARIEGDCDGVLRVQESRRARA